jgi:K+-transporting ATPase KdpF subunit
MAINRGRIFWSLRSSDRLLRPPEKRRLIVDWTTLLALIVTLALVAYLAIALLKPESFS